MPRRQLRDPDNRVSVGWFQPSGAVGSVDCVVSQRFTGGPATEQKHPCTLKQDRVSCAADHIVIERTGVAHRLILFLGSEMSGRPDSRGGREVRLEFLSREYPPDLRCEQRYFHRP